MSAVQAALGLLPSMPSLAGLPGLTVIYAGVCLTLMLLSCAGWLATRQPLWLVSSLFGLGAVALTALQLRAVATDRVPAVDGPIQPLLVVAACVHLILSGLLFWQWRQVRNTPGQLAQLRREHAQTAGLLSMLVHEVRNPLALVQVVARNIASGRTPPGEAQAAALRKIDRAVHDISAVLERCVETDLLERGALAAQPQPGDAASCLRDWLAHHRDRDRIQATLPDQLHAQLDAGLWLAMVRNLVENALKYAPAGAPIQLGLCAHGDQLQVEVRNPPGPAGRPDAARLFSKYYRSDQTAGIAGTGLGLYWVQQLSGKLGGQVQCLHPHAHDAADAPVVFRLSLPR